ncbi:12728_t:CDS:1, partial [Acaulospora colombiana]
NFLEICLWGQLLLWGPMWHSRQPSLASALSHLIWSSGRCRTITWARLLEMKLHFVVVVTIRAASVNRRTVQGCTTSQHTSTLDWPTQGH